jgi:hypothetical protein
MNGMAECEWYREPFMQDPETVCKNAGNGGPIVAWVALFVSTILGGTPPFSSEDCVSMKPGKRYREAWDLPRRSKFNGEHPGVHRGILDVIGQARLA